MVGFTNVFGGSPIQPSEIAYEAINLSLENSPYQLTWPTSFVDTTQVVARIMNITASASVSLADNPLTTDGSTAHVIVNTPTTSGIIVGTYVTISGATATGGITGANLNVSGLVTAVVPNVSFTYTANANSSVPATGGGSSVTFVVGKALGNNPITTDGSTSTVTVAIANTTGLVSGNYITISGVTGIVGGIPAVNLNITAQIGTVVANTSFTYMATAVSSSIATGGGASVTYSLGGPYAITLPNALEVSVGADFLVYNVGSTSFNVDNSAGTNLQTCLPGIAYYFWLTDNTTTPGTWSVIIFGASTNSSNILPGNGIVQFGQYFNTNFPSKNIAANYTAVTADRAYLLVWTGGTGTITLPSPVAQGYYLAVNNEGSGTLTVNTSDASTIDGKASITMPIGSSSYYIATQNGWNTLGFGQSSAVSTLPVSNGGTGNTSFTPYTVITAGITSTGPFQNVVGTGVLGYSLISSGPGGLPTWQLSSAATGGTGLTSFTPYAVLTGGTTSTGPLQQTTTGTTGYSLISQGASAVPVYAQFPGRNRLINGDFQVWQRGAGGTATFSLAATIAQYTADRWQALNAGSGATTISQVAGSTSGSYLCRVQRNSGSTSVGNLQIVTSLTRDMCIGAAGNIVTLSFKAACGANYSSSGSNLTIVIYTGTGSTDVSALTTGFTGSTSYTTVLPITTTLTNYSINTITLPSNVTQLAVMFYYTPTGTAGANDWFQVTDVQLEVSPYQTPYDRKAFDEEFVRCQRFYWKSFHYPDIPVQPAANPTDGILFAQTSAAGVISYAPTFFYPYEMIGTGTVAIYGYGANNGQVYDISILASTSSTTLNLANSKCFQISCFTAAGSVVGHALVYNATNDADLT